MYSISLCDTTLTMNHRRVGYIYDERCMWHEPRIVAPTPLLQPFQHWEDSETKRRLHNLLLVSKVYDRLVHLQPIKAASEDVISLVHSQAYIQDVKEKSKRLEGYTDGGEASLYSSYFPIIHSYQHLFFYTFSYRNNLSSIHI